MDTATAREIKRQLPRTWVPFFARFGHLTDVQLEAIPAVLSGRDVLIASPTASGKTEAVVAPIAEATANERWDGLSCVYVVPTRALANDLLIRIQGPLRECGITIAAKHSDTSRLPAEAPNWILTTPESLDSVIARRPGLLTQVRAVILDEIHLLDGTYRGDQMRVLLRRIERESQVRPRSYVMTASADDPDELAMRYTSDCDQIVVAGQRPIEASYLPDLDSLRHLTGQKRWKKVLVFCNRKAEVERVAGEMAPRWDPYPVVVHHGSLGRGLRSEAEEVLRTSPVAACVATSTLEVGIDIGDIDVVVFGEVPWSADALLQRIGRGNRRTDKCQIAFITDDPEERELARQMLAAARAGRFDKPPYEPDLSVAVQQMFSLLFQYPQGRTQQDLVSLVEPICPPTTAQEIIEHLGSEGQIEHRGDAWCASTFVMDMGESGRLHSNIPNSPNTLTVVEAGSGRQVGTVSDTIDGRFSLGQQVWSVVAVRGGRVEVSRGEGSAAVPRFRAASPKGAFYSFLPDDLRSKRKS